MQRAAVAPRRRSRRVNHDFARRAASGPSPCLIRPSRKLRTGGIWAATPRAPTPTRPAGGVPQRLGARVVGVGEVRAVRRQRGAAARDDRRVDRRQREQPEAEHVVAVRLAGDGTGAAALGTGLDALAGLATPRASASARENAPIAEWKVPPETMPADRTTPRICTGPEAPSCCTVNSAPRSCGIESNPQACTIRAPVRSRGVVVGDVHPVHELGLAGEVDVVGAGRGAGRDQRLAELLVGAHGRDDHPGPLGDVGCSEAGSVELDQEQLEVVERRGRSRRGRARTASSFTLLRPASAQRSPSGALPGEVLGRQRAGEPGRSEQQEVEVAICVVRACGHSTTDGTGLAHEASHLTSTSVDQGLAHVRPRHPLDSSPSQRSRRLAAAFTAGAVFAGEPADPDHARTASRPDQATLRRSRFAGSDLSLASSCEELLDWYVDRGVDRVGPWGWSSPYIYGDVVMLRDSQPPADMARSGSAVRSRRTTAGHLASRRTDGTGTNVQEIGVDEPDVVKTDGRTLFRVEGNDLVTYDVTGDRRRTARLRRPRRPGHRDPAGRRHGRGDRDGTVGSRLRAGLRSERPSVLVFDVSDPCGAGARAHLRLRRPRW